MSISVEVIERVTEEDETERLSNSDHRGVGMLPRQGSQSEADTFLSRLMARR